MSRFSFLVLSVLSLCAIPASSDDKAYAKSLLKFKQSLTNPTMLDNWQEPVDKLCSWNTPTWTGLLCANGSFVGIRLENMSLGGKIDVDSLSELPLLSLSVMHNNFSGQFPSGIKRLGKLRSLFLANNSFSGEIGDDAFSGMKGMRKVVLGGNFFTGKIPVSLLELPKLVDLQLQGNRFGGHIPDFRQAGLIVNFANNKLEGAIPAALRNQNASSFLGNMKLCGKPLNPCKPTKKSTNKIAFIAAAILVAFIILFLLFFYRKRAKPLKYQKSLHPSPKHKPNKTVTYKHSEQHGKLCFVRNDRERFELEELLRASAEVLGSGSFGSSYKASLFSGQVYVVRRFRQMTNVGKEGFYEHVRRLGRLSHRNLLPIVGFYYRREEKLLITDFVDNGSLASHLHGKRKPNQAGLDWTTRLRIIKGVARGLAHLYKELPTLTLPHGHLKSSNVLLDTTFEPILGDYALAPLINKDHAQEFMVAYKSPESTQNDRVTKKTDVWSLGILILELLTGRFPANYLKRGRGPSSDLATWVNSVAREEWTGEVFDKDMSNVARNGSEGQMMRLLKIGMCCCEWDVEKRWGLREAVERIEELKERDSDDDDYYSSSNNASHHQGDVYSSRAMTDDEISLSRA
ncbi:probable LRR receptor-like serine/threonine-protein kinase at4g31250 [Phtheirospermum japonicum]|uniref:Probable LRR receptor-like serine/threonine-protein kinase at4g31250 n=1 Tax=Phtheirospermum japonicum TaxID=374723 RepID=A0A830D5B0_9LAMI|nr:probable LRR receptor-like serine/threonine-protein kinase at4g31250 [Phtheirospermum japonicum]